MDTQKILEYAKKQLKALICEINSTVACLIGTEYQSTQRQFNKYDNRLKHIKKIICNEIIKAVDQGYKSFYCGLADDFELLCLEALYEIKNVNPNLTTIGILPHFIRKSNLQEIYGVEYTAMIKKLNETRYIFDKTTDTISLFERNKYMVNGSSLMIAYSNDPANNNILRTLKYAESQKLQIKIIGDE